MATDSVILTYYPAREFRPRRGARIIGSKQGVRIEPGTSTILSTQWERIKEVPIIKTLLDGDCLKVMKMTEGASAKSKPKASVWLSTQTQLSKINGISLNQAKAIQEKMPEDGWESMKQLVDSGLIPPGADMTALSEKFK